MPVKGGIFDLDGVITDTAKAHCKAWKKMFDEFLISSSAQPDELFTEADYLHYIDGKRRLDGILSFLKSRHLTLPVGSPLDDITQNTVYSLAKKKQQYFLDLLDREGIPVFESTLAFLHKLHDNHMKAAIVSSSKNCQMILKKLAIEELFETRVDGVVLDELGLAGKPQPDIFLEAANRMDIHPKDLFIVEDALSGIQAGRAGKFGLVIGIDRSGHMKQVFHDNGADIIINDMSEISFSDITERM